MAVHRFIFLPILLVGLVKIGESEGGDEDESSPVVRINDGGLRGFTMKSSGGRDFFAFQGIPFAQPPIGDLRFREPVKNLPWKGIRDAIAQSPTCIQTEFFQMYAVVGQEDCLYLNVYTPKLTITINGSESNKNNFLLPVMVGIPHGGFIFGGNHQVGPTYLMDENVVLVSMNYRLGALGFLSTGDEACYGNNGLKDQVLALKWIQENIHHFGGDPKKVTLFGESAGAASTHFHMLSPLTKGLFHRGISQSGCAFCFWSINERPMELTNTLARVFNCPTSTNNQELVDCLRSVNVTKLVEAQLLLLEWASYPVALVAPVIEPEHPGAYLTEIPEKIYKNSPHQVAKVPWIIGINSDELAVNLAAILLNPVLTDQFNDEWNTKVGPAMMELKNSTDDPEMTMGSIWKYYMGSDRMNFETRKKAVQMLSDRYLAMCTHKAIQYHALYTGMPVYPYVMNYVGNYSVVQLVVQDPRDWGVSHMDDLIYLVNNTEYYSTLKPDEEGYKFSRMITSMWVNFATFGVPVITNGENQLDIWEPVTETEVSNMKFLSLDMKPQMVTDPFVERVQFWDSLRLEEGYLDTCTKIKNAYDEVYMKRVLFPICFVIIT